MNIGNAVKKVRKHYKVTQVELCKRSGIAQCHISMIERDVHNPSVRTLKKICKALDIPVAIIYVLGMEGSDFPASRKEDYKRLYPGMVEFAIGIIGVRQTRVLRKPRV